METARPRKRLRADGGQIRDKFNLSNDHFYEVAKDGGRHRVRQTFGQLVVEHAYPAQKLQLPFVSFVYTLTDHYSLLLQYKTRLSKQEARSFHRPALQFPSNIELRFSKVRTAKKKKDKAGRKLGKGGNVGEGLRKTSDLSLHDTSNFVLWEYSVRFILFHSSQYNVLKRSIRKNILPLYQILVWEVCLSIIIAKKRKKMSMFRRSVGVLLFQKTNI